RGAGGVPRTCAVRRDHSCARVIACRVARHAAGARRCTRNGHSRKPVGTGRQGCAQRDRGSPMTAPQHPTAVRTGSRLAATFARLRAAQQPGLVTYVTAGDPDLPRTEGILRALDRAGADVIEVGVPFSDPLADGPVIQRATERALASGTTLAG